MCVGYFLCHQTGFLPTLLLPWPGVPFWGPRTSSLVREGKEPRGGGPGWGSLRGRTAGPGQRPARSPGRLGLSASGSGCGDLPRALGTRCSRLRSSSGPRGRSEAGPGGARGGRSGSWRLSSLRMNCCHAQLGEDEPVIIFKFAIIDLRKSYCDKNELIIKFISEINSAMIKQLAGAAGAARRVAFPAKSPRQAGPGSPAGREKGHRNYPRGRRESGSVAGAEGPNARRGLRPDAEAGCPLPPRPPPRVPGCPALRCGCRRHPQSEQGGGE